MQQKPVRYYITQDADEPVVRSVPVTPGPVAPARSADAQRVAETPPAPPERPAPTVGPVRKIVRAARRESTSAGR